MIGYGTCHYLVTQSLVRGITKSISGVCLIPLHADANEFLRCKYPDYDIWFVVKHGLHIDIPLFTHLVFLYEQ